MTGQITVNATRPVAGGRNINIVRVPIHPPQMAEKTVEEKRGRARNVNWLRAEVKWSCLDPHTATLIDMISILCSSQGEMV